MSIERILRGIKENSKGDETLEEFLKEIIHEEIGHPGRWGWREYYRKKIKEYSSKWGGSYEDRQDYS